MKCANCGRTTSRMIYRNGVEACAGCYGLSETAGVKIDGSLTRPSQRVRDQQRTNEGDMIPPHVIDRATQQIVPNPDYMRMYPDQIAKQYSQSELEKAGHSKIAKVFKQSKEQHAAQQRDYDAGVTYRKTPVPGSNP